MVLNTVPMSVYNFGYGGRMVCTFTRFLRFQSKNLYMWMGGYTRSPNNPLTCCLSSTTSTRALATNPMLLAAVSIVAYANRTEVSKSLVVSLST